jgi:uncharacterized OB-fold protein
MSNAPVAAPAAPTSAPAGRKIPAPRVLPETLAYWQAADQGRLLVKRCTACGEYHHYPRDICPFCWSEATVWTDASGLGSVYSFSTMGKDESAYTLAQITLDEGPTMMSNLVDCDPRALRIGQRVKVVFKSSDGGHAVPMFTPIC